MEELLDAADALVALNPEGEPERPDFTLPENLAAPWLDLMETKEGIKGRGWFARSPISAGTAVLVDKPLAMVMNWQDTLEDDEEDNEAEDEASGSILNDLLLLELLEAIQQDPSLWTVKLSQMYPRDKETAASLPVWICQDDAVFVEIEARIQQLSEIIPKAKNDIAKRLPLVVRYNVLSVETCSELLVHPSPNGHASLSGEGLYYLPSYFNHSSKPNVSRWAIGDIMWFVANQDINQGEELCISYLEHDVLCESPARRTLMLDMDFADGNNEDEDDGDDGPLLPVVDDEAQNELMSLDPLERLDAIQELMDQATGEALPEEEVHGNDDNGDAMEVNHPGWFKCDAQNLRIIKAITLDGVGQSKEALKVWEECIVFAETMLPPNDESLVVMQVQAALCAWHGGDEQVARAHAVAAVQTHKVMFRGDISLFRRRYRNELNLSLRPSSDVVADADALWPMAR